REDVLGLWAFTQGHCHALHLLLERVPPAAVKQKLLVKQLLYCSLQLFTTVAYDAFQSCQLLPSWPGLEQLLEGCRSSVRWMLEALEGLPQSERAKYLDMTASCTFKLAYIFYSQSLHREASSVCEILCQSLQAEGASMSLEIPAERLHKCFRLQVETHCKLGEVERALGCVVQWLSSLQEAGRELLAEPVSLWVRVKAEAARQGAQELRCRTLRDALEGQGLAPDSLVRLLFAELKACKGLRGQTGPERHSVLSDLLGLCPEASGRLLQRASSLTELAQLLCYHSYSQHTACSPLDSVQEALRLLELVPRSSQNQAQLLDEQAQALLWLFICTLESKLEKSIEREQRARAQGLRSLEDFEPNDLHYEARLLQDSCLYEGISFNLLTETAVSKSLDDAFSLWKQLLEAPGVVPAVRCPEQTVASLHLLAALYKLLGKPLQAMESYLLVRALCSTLGDSLGAASALCHLTKLLCQLECPSYAQLFLEEAESWLQKAESSDSSYLLLQQTCLLLHSQLCCANHQIEKGLSLLLEVLQNPALHKSMKVWYLLRAHVLCLVATYLSLPPGHLPLQLRQQLFQQGWKSPKTALLEAQKLLRSIILLLLGGEVLGCQPAAADGHFVDSGDNLLLKWHVLAELLACSEHLVALLSRLEVVCKAKAFCLEAVKLAMKLQATRRCTALLVLKAQLELQQDELEQSSLDLQQVLFLLQSQTEFKASQKQKTQVNIQLRKGQLEGKKPQEPIPEPPGEEESFLKGPTLEFVATVSRGEQKDAALTASPELKPRKRRSLSFLSHPAACCCCLCSDLALSSLCLRWLLCQGQGALAAGREAEGLALLRALPPRCSAVAARFSALLETRLIPGQQPPALELLHDLVATAYATLALQSLASPQLLEELQEELEKGWTFLECCRPHLPSLGVSRASLLLAKATATLCHLASQLPGSLEGTLATTPSCQLPSLPPAKPQVPSLPPAKPQVPNLPPAPQTDKAEPPKCKAKASPAPAAPRARGRRCQGAKALPVPGSDSDSEVPASLPRGVAVPCTPHPKSCALPKARGAPAGSRTPFTIFKESSPPPGSKSYLLRAPRAVGRVKSRLKVTFSDDSDEDATAEPPQPPCRRPPLSPRPLGCQVASRGRRGPGRGSQPRRGRAGGCRAAGEGKAASRRAPSRRAQEQRDILRSTKEQEVQEELEMSFEDLQVAKEEEEAPTGRRQLPGCRQEARGRQQEAPEDIPAAQSLGSGHPLHPKGTFSSALPTAGGLPSLDTVLQLLRTALNCISHCPPGTLYSQLCQLLAQAMGDQDPLLTAYLLSESVSITTRHQLLSLIHRKMQKEKKAAGDLSEHLQGLSLQEGKPAQHSHHLSELEELFGFSPRELGPEERARFQAQLQQIPKGVTVCVLALTSSQPGSAGDMLLLTRLERGSSVLNLRIPTALTEAPLCSVLSDFDSIQREQKETSSCTDKQDWWLRRSELDRRMKSLIETLEMQVLGCWRGVLIPSSPEPRLAEEAAHLHSQLCCCGWREPDPALLQVVLNAASFLTPQDVQALASGLCPAQPHRAQLLLEEAVEKWRSCTLQNSGSLVLVLDKHLQKLPWESMSCLRAVPVTRLPSLRFLLSYSLAQQRAGSVLSRGVNPSSTFYVLNPHSNLMGTEERFRGWFESEPGWRGVTGTIPSTKQMQAALLEHDLYIYAGHGAGARLLDGQSISRLQCRAVVLLFGCSSAALALRGSLEGSGIVLKYIMAGWRWSSSHPPSLSSRWCRPSTWRPRTVSMCSTRAMK
ncbi:ESPL1 protein, partial [Galbula dea]|nr:ESPL1 protein [Galbula dea]